MPRPRITARKCVLLATVLVVAAAVAAYAVKLHRYRRAYDRLLALGATVKFRGPGWARSISKDRPLPGIDDVTSIALPDAAADESTFPVIADCLRQFPELKDLGLPGATIAETQSAAFDGFGSRLESLDLSRATIGDEGVEHLRHMTQLRRLDLSNTQVTDRGLIAVGELKSLRLLNLDHTAVGDGGIVRLGELSRLQELNVADTDVTDEGVEKLHAMLPDVEIYDD